jgi:hypothetical protein
VSVTGGAGAEDDFESVDKDSREGSKTGFLLYDLNNANIPPPPPEAGDSLGAGAALTTELDAEVELEVVLPVSDTASTVDGFVLRRRSTYANFAKSGLAFFTKNMRAAVSK